MNKKHIEEIVRRIIQGGMGVGVSGWKLAKASACAGAVGTVSGTAVANLLANELQKGDKDGNFRRALASFAFPKIAQEVLDAYYVPGGIEKKKKQKEIPIWSFKPARILIALTICANYAFVWLAKEGHKNPIFVNYLEKIQMPHIYSILGAILANVDGVVMGAGIPANIPKVIDDILAGNIVAYPIFVKNHPLKSVLLKFDPIEFFGEKMPEMIRPVFLPIVSSNVLAEKLLKMCAEKIDGFIVETDTAGGHNAPPRGVLQLDKDGQPIYGERDKINFEKFQILGVPFWLAGSFASPEGLAKARELGASGIQAGTIFAFAEESGIEFDLKQRAIMVIRNGLASVFTSPTASPTGFPFKILDLMGTLIEKSLYTSRKRVCSLGYLREAVWLDEKIVFRCPAEPVADYIHKGGCVADTIDCMCVCAGLCATVDAREGEIPLVTAGDDLSGVLECIMANYHPFRVWAVKYTALDAVQYISR
jgi:nitronate monooxygenase